MVELLLHHEVRPGHVNGDRCSTGGSDLRGIQVELHKEGFHPRSALGTILCRTVTCVMPENSHSKRHSFQGAPDNGFGLLYWLPSELILGSNFGVHRQSRNWISCRRVPEITPRYAALRVNLQKQKQR